MPTHVRVHVYAVADVGTLHAWHAVALVNNNSSVDGLTLLDDQQGMIRVHADQDAHSLHRGADIRV